MSLLKIESLTKNFGGLSAVDNVSFAVGQGQIVGLIGPNGAGKTTCFNLISGFIKPTKGRVDFAGEDITGLLPNQIARKGAVRTFQHTSVFSEMSVFENVIVGQYLHMSRHMWDAFFRRRKYRQTEAAMEKKAVEILDLMGLLEKADYSAKNLPYGELRKLEIAIALAADPKLLMLDEPAAGMNETESANLVDVIRKIRDSGKTVLIVEHDMKVVMNLCDTIVVMDQGKKIAEGTPREIRTNAEVIKVYLGDVEEHAG